MCSLTLKDVPQPSSLALALSALLLLFQLLAAEFLSRIPHAISAAWGWTLCRFCFLLPPQDRGISKYYQRLSERHRIVDIELNKPFY